MAGAEMGPPAGIGKQPDDGGKGVGWVRQMKEEPAVPMVIQRGKVNRDGVTRRLTADIPSCLMAGYARWRTELYGTSIHPAKGW